MDIKNLFFEIKTPMHGFGLFQAVSIVFKSFDSIQVSLSIASILKMQTIEVPIWPYKINVFPGISADGSICFYLHKSYSHTVRPMLSYVYSRMFDCVQKVFKKDWFTALPAARKKDFENLSECLEILTAGRFQEGSLPECFEGVFDPLRLELLGALKKEWEEVFESALEKNPDMEDIVSLNPEITLLESGWFLEGSSSKGFERLFELKKMFFKTVFEGLEA